MPQEFQVVIGGFEIVIARNTIIPWEFEGK